MIALRRVPTEMPLPSRRTPSKTGCRPGSGCSGVWTTAPGPAASGAAAEAARLRRRVVTMLLLLGSAA